jgi:hypothetical protein
MTSKTLARLAFLVLAVGLVYGGLDIAGAAPPGGVSGGVTVQNTPTNPVPVSGSVDVGNTPGVKIDPTGNTVQISGTPTVNVNNASLPVAGTVKIDPSGNTVQTTPPRAPNVHHQDTELNGPLNFWQTDDNFASINASEIVLTNTYPIACIATFFIKHNSNMMFDITVPFDQTVTIPLPETVPVDEVQAFEANDVNCGASWTIVGN